MKNLATKASATICAFVFALFLSACGDRPEGGEIKAQLAKEANPVERYLVTVEEHFTDDRIVKANAKFAKPVKLSEEQKSVRDFFMSRMFLGNTLTDTDSGRLSHMDSMGVKIQVLSYTTPVTDNVPAEEAVKICKLANDILAERVKAHPDRYRAMATLPMGDPVAAAAELERTVKELGFVGVLLAGQYRGRWYDEPEFLPIFEKAAELDVPVYFHPYLVNPAVQQAVYMSSAYSPIVGAEFASAGFGWHLDVGISVVRLILAGIFDKFPNLKFVAGHWGEGIPMMLDRMDYQLTQDMTKLKHPVSYYYKNNVYLTPSGIMSEQNLKTMVEIMGADHIIYSEDYPYYRPSNFADFLWNNSFLTDEQKELIAHKNAERLYRLK